LTYRQVCKKSYTTGATSGAGTANSSGSPKYISVFSGVRAVQ